jgi:plastocyanin
MGKWLGAVAIAAVVALGGPVARPAAADDMNMNMNGATCSPTGTSLTLTAQDHQFDKNCLAVPAGQPFTIHFDNKDADRHNVAILPSHMATEAFFRGEIVPGPKSITYSVPALKPGTWHFHCEIHPNLMNGTFIVAAAPAAPVTASAPAPTPAPAPTASPAPNASPTPPPATSMGGSGGMPVLTPTPTTASAPSTPPAAASAPSPAPPAPSRSAAGAASAAQSASPPAAGNGPLPRTGPASDRLLLVLAGAALALGGLSVAAAARRPRSAR